MTQEPFTQEQLEWIAEAQRRGVHKALKRYVLGAALGFLVMFGGLTVASRAWTNTLHEGLVGSCNRVNVLRAQSNGSDLVSFRILSISGQRERTLAENSKGVEKATHEKSSQALFGEAARLTVTALTNCSEAVDHPKTYNTPIAGPIGDPATGELNQGVRQTLNDSLALLRQEATNDR